MRWYDYIACIWFANQITFGLLFAEILTLLFGVLGYKVYEEYRAGRL